MDDFMTYNGTKTVTVSGRVCQEWRTSYPHKHTKANNPIDATMENSHNYCRFVRFNPLEFNFYGKEMFTKTVTAHGVTRQIQTKNGRSVSLRFHLIVSQK